MQNLNQSKKIKAFCFVAAFLSSNLTFADHYAPKSVVKIVVSSAAGSSPDITTRIISQELSTLWKQPVVVEDVTGAGGNLAAEKIAKSKPDGPNFLFASAAVLYFNQSLYAKLNYSLEKDLVPVIRVTQTPNLLVVSSNSKFHSLNELINESKAKPNSLRFGSGGSGSSMHILAEVLSQQANVKFEHIPYKSSSQMLQEVMANEIDFSFHNIAVVMPFVKAGKLRALAVTSDKRFFLDRNIPTLKELGWPVVWEGGSGILAPSGTPAVVVDQVGKDVEFVLSKDQVKSALRQNGLEPAPLLGAAFAQSISQVSHIWSNVISSSGAKVD